MLRSKNVTVGKYYVNYARKIAREVLEIDEKTVLFNTYHLDTGNSCHSPSQCTKRDFIQWADHEATPAETAHLQLLQQEAMVYMPQLPSQPEVHRRPLEPLTVPLRAEPSLQ